jgi:phytoene dehydrogenase-like protein
VLARAGRRVLVLEAGDDAGRRHPFVSALLRPDVLHDVCSAIHPLALASPAFRLLADDGSLAAHGLDWVHPTVPLAHPLDDGRRRRSERSVDDTAAGLGADAAAYRGMMGPFVDAGFALTDGLLSPLQLPPPHPGHLARFGWSGIRSARGLVRSRFDGDEAQALFAGLAAHSLLSLRSPSTAAYGLVLGVLGHVVGWPMARGGSQRIADALVGIIEAAGAPSSATAASARSRAPAVERRRPRPHTATGARRPRRACSRAGTHGRFSAIDTDPVW